MTFASFSFYTGPMFEFIAGPDHKSFLVHASVLTKSDKLKAIVEGEWKDSTERKIVLKDWDEETVRRLLEWLYTRDYSSPCPTTHVYSIAALMTDTQRAPDGEEIAPVAVPMTEDFYAPNSGQQETSLNLDEAPIADKEHPPQPLTPLTKQTFLELFYQYHRSPTEIFDFWLRCCKHHPHQHDFEATFLANAKVYSLAKYMLLEELQALAFGRLRSILAWIDSRITPKSRTIARSPTVRNLVALTRYVYGNTSRPNIGEEPLQKLLTTFIAINFSGFDDGEEGDVRRLMDEGGDFTTDVWEKVSSHMGVLEKELRESREKAASLEVEILGLRRKWLVPGDYKPK